MISNVDYYEHTCWCQFGKEFSSDNAGDGPVDDWALGYKRPPFSQRFIQRALSRYVFSMDELHSTHPLDWL